MNRQLDDITSKRRKRGSSVRFYLWRVVSKAALCLHAITMCLVLTGSAMQVKKNNNNITGQDALSNLGALFVF